MKVFTSLVCSPPLALLDWDIRFCALPDWAVHFCALPDWDVCFALFLIGCPLLCAPPDWAVHFCALPDWAVHFCAALPDWAVRFCALPDWAVCFALFLIGLFASALTSVLSLVLSLCALRMLMGYDDV